MTHSTEYSEKGRFVPPYYSPEANYAVCTCGREFHGEQAFVAIGVHKQMANKKELNALFAKADALIAEFAMAPYSPTEGYWLRYAATRFGGMHDVSKYTDPRSMAIAVLNYFENTDYQPTIDPSAIARATYRAAS